jgi:2,5-furandicarboxylate decarboxylase 1
MDFQDCLARLEAAGRLLRVATEVDLRHEAAGIAKKFEGREVLLFERLKGQDYPLAIGLWWNRDNLACLFDTTADRLPALFARAVKALHSAPVAPLVTESAPAQELSMPVPDLRRIPVPVLALEDGGPYLDNCVVIAKDPDTGVRNASVHRLMVSGPDRLGLLMDVGRHLRDYYERAEARGESLELTINNGVHPAYYVAAITPSAAAPIEVDELAVASFLLGEPARLCRSKSVAVEGIADAQLIIEGEILPGVREPEGPFGEVGGYYALREDRWVVRVRAVTHRARPIIHSLLPGREVWNSMGLNVEANIFDTVSRQVKGLKNVYLTHGSGTYHAIIQIDPVQRGAARNAILATFASFYFLQMVTAVNSDVNIFDAEEVEHALATRCRPDEDIIIIPGCFGHELNPATDNGLGAKVGFDCTCPLPRSPKFNKVKFMEVNLADYDIGTGSK